MVVALPEITPVLGDKWSPGGNELPLTAAQLHVWGATPPDAVSENPLVPPYGAPIIASGGSGEVMASGEESITVIV